MSAGMGQESLTSATDLLANAPTSLPFIVALPLRTPTRRAAVTVRTSAKEEA
jgi:hypothetical protein